MEDTTHYGMVFIPQANASNYPLQSLVLTEQSGTNLGGGGCGKFLQTTTQPLDKVKIHSKLPLKEQVSLFQDRWPQEN